MKVRARISGRPCRATLHISCVALCGIALFAAAPAVADPVAEFYRGKSISITVGTSAGGTYDIYARLTAPFLTRYLPGNPEVVVLNRPGAGGLVATNWLYALAPKDGSAIATYSNRAAFEPLFGNEKAVFDPLKLNWLISISKQYVVGVVKGTHPARSVADLGQHEIVVAGSGTSGSTVVMPTLFNAILGTKFRIVRGYQGLGDMFLSLKQGETDGVCCTDYSGVMTQVPQEIANGSIRFVIQAGVTRHPAIPDVPWVPDMIKSGADKQVLDLFLAPQLIGRPYGAPPGVPEDRVAALRGAFESIVRDPEFIVKANRAGVDVDPASAEEIMAMLKEVFASPPEAIERARAIMKSLFAR